MSDPASELSRLHARLRRSLDGVDRALGAALGRGCAVGPLPSVAASLRREGEQLCADVRLAQQEPDPGLRGAWADWLMDHVEEHARLCTDLRRALHRVEMASLPNHLAQVDDPFARP